MVLCIVIAACTVIASASLTASCDLRGDKKDKIKIRRIRQRSRIAERSDTPGWPGRRGSLKASGKIDPV